ncbi:O-antigen ligase family protein [Arthrobacter sp. B2a2-09]|uniref:O-antigen ligase family protein n=1 Tax=Arthrobacter sp. B2a2-09 TaxID=2952822 RepID=UPI0022CD9B0B|nr:O-antigen ligase family protein [Arthrobacter sp. B2a2-09]
MHKFGDVAWVAGSMAAVGLAVLLAIKSPTVAVAVFGVIVWVVVAKLRPAWMFHLTLVTAFLAVPAFVPKTIPTPVGGLFIFEPFLLGCVVVGLFKKGDRLVPRSLLVFIAASALAFFIGIYNQTPSVPRIADIRPLIDVVLGVVAGANILNFTSLKTLIRTTKWILWISLGMTLAGSFGVLDLVGRSEVASLVGDTTGADRLITPATYFALAVACGVIAAMVTAKASARTILSLATPAFAIIFLSFSRNNILALCVAFAWALIAAGPASRKVAGVGKLLFIALIGGVAITALMTLFDIPWLQEQLDGFGSRVLGGLSADAIQADGSAQFRVGENDQILPVIGTSPFWGLGFGAAYKDPYGPIDYFTSTTAPYYAHNYYYWLMLKGGVVALAAFALLVLRPVFAVLGANRPRLAVTSAVLLAFLVVSTVAPMPNGFPTGLLFGLLVGLAHRFTSDAPMTQPVMSVKKVNKSLPAWAAKPHGFPSQRDPALDRPKASHS